MTCLDRELEGGPSPAVDLLRVAVHVFTERFSLLSAGRSLAWQSRYEGADGLLEVGRDGGHQDGHHPQAGSHAVIMVLLSSNIFSYSTWRLSLNFFVRLVLAANLIQSL